MSSYDIVLMGATSFVGEITARRFAELLTEKKTEATVAFAGRSKTKLEGVVTRLKAKFPNVQFDVLVADSHDESAMKQLVEQAKVIISTVGPYDLYGEPLVKACVESGTHYCDLTGEPQFVHRMIQKYEAQAKQSGACIVCCSGFDSIPSDMGVYFLQQHASKEFGEACNEVDMRVKGASGGFSGGTISSLMNVVKQTRVDPKLKKVLFNPYTLCPESKPEKQAYVGKAQRDWATDQWIAPFIMAGINSKIVLRTAQLKDDLYPTSFRYNEAMFGGRGGKGRRKAKMISFGLGVITVGSAFGASRWLLEKVLPSPGEGPTETAQKEGFFSLVHFGKTASGKTMAVKVTGDEDPGYGSTSKMLAQTGLALLNDLPSDQAGGMWTPASLLGDALLKRLPEHAGITFEVLPANG